MIQSESTIDIGQADAKELEFVDLFIPIVRYGEGNYWSAFGVYSTEDEAKKSLFSATGITQAKILHHVERFNKALPPKQ